MQTSKGTAEYSVESAFKVASLVESGVVLAGGATPAMA